MTGKQLREETNISVKAEYTPCTSAITILHPLSTSAALALSSSDPGVKALAGPVPGVTGEAASG
eukprot:778713-Pelagomonas_calceolata.AAC.1